MQKVGYSIPKIFTTRDTSSNLTGAWRFMKPVFTEKTAPCMEACPAGNPIPEFMAFVIENKYEEALQAVKQENPLPSICGRVCPHPCTKACNRREFDSELAVNEAERFIGDTTEKFGLCTPEPVKTSGKRIAIIGSGPGGLSCAYQSALLGHEVTIFEADDRPGGMLRYGIPAYRLPRDVLDRELQFIRELGIKIITSTRIDSDRFIDLPKEFDAICIATGAHKSYRLGIEGEGIKAVISGIEFLNMINLGKPVRPDKKTLVIGGGNTAMDAARTALRLGADVTVVYRRTQNEMPAFLDEIREALEEGIKFVYLAAPVKIIGKNGKLKSIQFIRMRQGELDESGRARSVPIKGEYLSLEANTVITAIGESAEFDLQSLLVTEKKRNEIYLKLMNGE